MQRKTYTPFVIATLLLLTYSGIQANEFDRDAYVKSIITVLRIHANAIRNLTIHEMKYSDNLVRHAIALQNTFGLVGPMDWHVVDAQDHLTKQRAAKTSMDAEKFERLGIRSKKAMKNLILATHEYMEHADREELLEALNAVQDSCNACHSYLPKSVAPDVWGTLQRKK